MCSKRPVTTCVVGQRHRSSEVVEKSSFDVIVTDLQMPGMDGLAFIRTLSERKVESQIVMITRSLR